MYVSVSRQTPILGLVDSVGNYFVLYVMYHYTYKGRPMRLTIWERIEILFIQHVFIPIFCIWLGRYLNKIIVKGDYGRKSIYYEKI